MNIILLSHVVDVALSQKETCSGIIVLFAFALVMDKLTGGLTCPLDPLRI